VELLKITKIENYRQPDANFALHSSLRQSVYSPLFITDLELCPVKYFTYIWQCCPLMLATNKLHLVTCRSAVSSRTKQHSVAPLFVQCPPSSDVQFPLAGKFLRCWQVLKWPIDHAAHYVAHKCHPLAQILGQFNPSPL
jgi:hypothetical protein